MPVSIMPHIAYVGLGSNLQDPRRQLQRAFADLDGLPATRVLARSSTRIVTTVAAWNRRHYSIGYPVFAGYLTAYIELN